LIDDTEKFRYLPTAQTGQFLDLSKQIQTELGSDELAWCVSHLLSLNLTHAVLYNQIAYLR
jgi:hypothetical protein